MDYEEQDEDYVENKIILERFSEFYQDLIGVCSDKIGRDTLTHLRKDLLLTYSDIYEEIELEAIAYRNKLIKEYMS